jgi:cell division protein FtsB
MENAYDFKRVERRNIFPVRFFGPIEKKYLGFLGLLIFGVLLFTIFGSRGLMQIYHLREERDRIQVNNARLEDENKKLVEQIRLLRTDKHEIERIAREEMMLVRKGEIVYQFEK